MSIDLHCPGCRGVLRVSDEHLGKLVRCSARGATFPAAPAAPVLPEPLPEPVPLPPLDVPLLLAALDHSPPSLREQNDVPLRVQVLHDSSHILYGRTAARLTRQGFHIGKGEDLAVVRPGECVATFRRGDQFVIESGGRRLVVKVGRLGVYGERLARDLVALLNGEHGPIVLTRYRLEWYVWLLAMLPVGILVMMRGGALWGALAGAMVGLALYVAQRERLPGPVRLGGMFLVGVASYALVVGILLAAGWPLPWPVPVGADQWRRFSPRGEPISVELPGKPKAVATDPHTVFLGIQPRLWTVELKPQDLGFTVGIAEQDVSRAGPQGQLDGARNDLLGSRPGSQLIAEREVSVEGRRGREIEIRLPGKGTIVGRLILVEDQLIAQLVASSRLESYRAEVDRFFNSLKIIRGAPRGVMPP